jgi:FkbM family methyltransferase
VIAEDTKSTLASFIGRRLPGLSRSILRFTGGALPNLWFFHYLVRECGVKIATKAKLGNGMRVKVFLGDMIGCHIWHSGWYENHLVQAIGSFLQPNVCFFDIGANIGQYTLLAAPLVKEVHSFEASAETFGLLSWNVQYNRLANVHLNQAAVSDREGVATIFESGPDSTGQASLRQTGNQVGRQYPVRTIALDDYVRSSNLEIEPRKVIIKIDVEGAELFVLEGARQLLQSKPVLVLEAIDELQRNFARSVFQLIAYLQDRGYVLHSLTEHGLAPYNYDCPNILALPRE